MQKPESALKSLEIGEDLACVDVAYHDNNAVAGAVLFDTWTTPTPSDQVATSLMVVEPYLAGEFFRRELPPILKVLGQLHELPRAIVVDGYVWLNERNNRMGLGAHLYTTLGGRVPVIGISKSFFRGNDAIHVLRGQSKRPLYVTSAGIAASEAASFVSAMHGNCRFPTLVQSAHRLCQEGLYVELAE